MTRIVLALLVLAVPLDAAAVPARSFHVEVSGSGPPLIFIPGLSCGGDVWRRSVERYRARHQVHVLTLAGFAGEPATAATPFLETVRRDLAGYIRARHLERPVVVGHSLGGFVALWLAASEPTLLGGVVAVDALPYLGAAQNPAATVEATRPLAEQMRTMMAAAPPQSFAAQNHAALTAMITDPKDVEAVFASSRRSDPKAIAQAIYEMMVTDLRAAVAAITMPTLVLIAGEGDGKSARVPFDAQYQKLRGAQLRLAERARHFVMLDDPTFFEAALDAFLARVQGGA